jgi:hypothetical protein
MTTQEITEYHRIYRESTGLDVKLNFYRESVWREWIRYGNQNCGGFTMDDLRAVVAIRKRREKEKAHGVWSVNFNALIGSPDVFEEDLASARASLCKPKVDRAKQSVLQSSGRNHEPNSADAAHVSVPVEQLIANLKAAVR